MSTSQATISRTAKGYAIAFPTYTANIGATYTHVVTYPTGGWNPATKASDLPCFTKHKSAAAAAAAARDLTDGGGTVTALADL